MMHIPMRFAWLLLVLIILSGLARVLYLSVHYPEKNDEAAHVTTGLEWWLYGSYTYERLHPPLARIAAAIPTYLTGRHPQPADAAYPCHISFYEHYRWVTDHHKGGGFGSPCLENSRYQELFNGPPDRDIRLLSRISTYASFVLAVAGMFLLGREVNNNITGLLAALLFSLNLTVVEFSAFIMTDMPMTAFVIFSIWAWVRWLRKPTCPRMICWAAMSSAAIMCKYSALYFLPPCFLIWWWVARPDIRLHHASSCHYIKQFMVALIVGFLLCWALFRFSLDAPEKVIPTLHQPAMQQAIPEIIRTAQWMPLSEMVQGLYELKQKNIKGHDNAYWLDHRDFYPPKSLYYPLGYVVRAALVVVLLNLAAMALILARPKLLVAQQRPLIAATASLIVLGAMLVPSNIHLNMHHAMLLFVFGSLSAALVWPILAQKRQWVTYGLAAIMLAEYIQFWYDYRPFYALHNFQGLLVEYLT